MNARFVVTLFLLSTACLRLAIAGEIDLPSTAAPNKLWPLPSIQVCWESNDSQFASEKRWTQDAVQASWPVHAGLSFTGWRACSAEGSAAQQIRISIQDANPHTKGLGRDLNKKQQGMVLNFTFDKWSQSCKFDREKCIKTISVHEFGHAIGFAHEQNRKDSPEWCRADAQGTDGDWYITPFDLDSVMNYCNPKWNGNGQLSAKDIEGAKAMYPKYVAKADINPDIWYRIITRVSAQCIHVENSNSDRRNALWQWPCQKTPAFKFRFEPTTDGYYKIRTAFGQCIHMENGPSTESRHPLWQWECVDQPHFKFKIEKTEDGWHRIQSSSGVCFHVRNGPSKTPREPLWSWPCVNQPHFFFLLQGADF